MGSHATHQYAEATHFLDLTRENCQLKIVQQPVSCKVNLDKAKDRKPIDPPPIIQLIVDHSFDPHHNYLQSPYFFLSCSLYGCTGPEGELGLIGSTLTGTIVSSLHKLKDESNNDGAFFIFGDLSVKQEGIFQLQFDLFEMRHGFCTFIDTVRSLDFKVESTRNYIGLPESTPLTRVFSKQGVRLRLRKEPRQMLRKRGPADDDYEPKRYQKQQRQRDTSPTMECYNTEDPADRVIPHEYSALPQQLHYAQDLSIRSNNCYTGDYCVAEHPMRDHAQNGPKLDSIHEINYLDIPMRSYQNTSVFNPNLPQVENYSYAQAPNQVAVSREQEYSNRGDSDGVNHYTYRDSAIINPSTQPLSSQLESAFAPGQLNSYSPSIQIGLQYSLHRTSQESPFDSVTQGYNLFPGPQHLLPTSIHANQSYLTPNFTYHTHGSSQDLDSRQAPIEERVSTIQMHCTSAL